MKRLLAAEGKSPLGLKAALDALRTARLKPRPYDSLAVYTFHENALEHKNHDW